MVRCAGSIGHALLAKVLWMVRCTGALAKVLGEACSLCMRIHLMDGTLRNVLYAWDFVVKIDVSTPAFHWTLQRYSDFGVNRYIDPFHEALAT